MGNQSSNNAGRAEPLESYMREMRSNDHLRNLGARRQTSFRKSLRKKLSKSKLAKQPEAEQATDAADGRSLPDSATQQAQESPQRMDNLRRSLRQSLRRKKDKSRQEEPTKREPDPSDSRSKLWQEDDVAVRAGTCHFEVKYLGCIEVYDSRGMGVCEEALRKLKSSKKKSVRSILYVNGDGLRIVDGDTKGLLVDQTIEGVSFCAPDHNFDRGFSYICRDGTTRRWLCHGFMAVKESGDRLSHAVGCAFAVCLEKKQKRDQDCSVTMTFDKKESSFTRIGSFRQATITERLSDPQGIKPSEPPPKPSGQGQPEDNPFAIARPHATDLMLQRQTSFREFSRLQSKTSPFKRQLSLRLSELPSSIDRRNSDANCGVVNPSSLDSQHSVEDQGKLCQRLSSEPFFGQPAFTFSPFKGSELSTVPEVEPASPPSQKPDTTGPRPETESNPWDLVPDQPGTLAKSGSLRSSGSTKGARTINNASTGAPNLSNGSAALIRPPRDATVPSGSIWDELAVVANGNGPGPSAGDLTPPGWRTDAGRSELGANLSVVSSSREHGKDHSVSSSEDFEGSGKGPEGKPLVSVGDQPPHQIAKAPSQDQAGTATGHRLVANAEPPTFDPLVPNGVRVVDHLDPKEAPNLPRGGEKIRPDLMDDPFDADWVSLALNRSNIKLD